MVAFYTHFAQCKLLSMVKGSRGSSPKHVISENHLFKPHLLMKQERENWRKAFCLLVLAHDADTEVNVMFLWQDHTRASDLMKERKQSW